MTNKKKHNRYKSTNQVGVRLPVYLIDIMDDFVSKNPTIRNRSHLVYLAIAEWLAVRLNVESVEEFHKKIFKK